MYNHRVRSGSCVSFRLGDAMCPGFGQIASQLSPDVRVCGEVAFFSDNGRDKGHFAIITVEGIATPLIVPVAKIEVSTAHPGRAVETLNEDGYGGPRPGDLVPEESKRISPPRGQREAG